ncbi:hypothetical protein [Jiulongibacter sp. NS-SX5]|uniref:hypothetical protein n=1 Tax=Jiulongibacter sp. NS-SX5 TaxID=3463854 RepID=UPI0040586743
MTIAVKKLFLLLCFLSCPVLVNAAYYEWTGAGNGTSWEDPGNWSTLTVPGANSSDTVLISSPAQVITVSTNRTVGYLIMTKANLVVQASSRFSLLTYASSPVDDYQVLMMSNSVIEVYGDMSLRSSDDHFAGHLTEASNLIVRPSGSLKIRLTDRGIEVDASSTLTITNTAEFSGTVDSLAILNHGLINNFGEMLLNVGHEGIENDGTFYTTDSLAIIGVSNSGYRGLVNSGNFQNSGQVFIEGLLFNGIYNTGSVVNEATGKLEIKYLSGFFTPGSTSFYTSGLFQNKGEATILANLQYGLFNQNNVAGIFNSGNLNVSSADSLSFVNTGKAGSVSQFTSTGHCDFGYGLFNSEHAVVNWQSTGAIDGPNAILNQGDFTVDDSLSIDAVEFGIQNEGVFTVNSVLTFENAKKAITNNGQFVIGASGTINTGFLTASLDNYALKIHSSFINNGELTIPSGSYGILNEDNTEGFVNNGAMTISGISFDFIRNEGLNADTSVFENNGTLMLMEDGTPHDDTGNGIVNSGKARFTNTGGIEMSALWYDFQNIVNGSLFENFGEIDIKETQGIHLNNSGTFQSNENSVVLLNCDENFNDFGILNDGVMALDGVTRLIYEDAYSRNPPLIQNNSTLTNNGLLEITAGGESDGLVNNGTFTNEDSLVMFHVNHAIDNQGVLLSKGLALIDLDTVSLGITCGTNFTNQGTLNIRNGGSGMALTDGHGFINEGTFRIEDMNGYAVSIDGLGATFVNETSGEIEISLVDASLITDENIVRLEEGAVTNNGVFEIHESVGTALNIIGGAFTNNDSLLLSQIEAQTVAIQDGGTFVNNSYFYLSGESQENATLFRVYSGSQFTNTSTLELEDAFKNGINVSGEFISTEGSLVKLTNHTRNTGTLFNVSNTTSPVIYYGDVIAENAQNCLVFAGEAENHGFLNLKSCGMSMAAGTNKPKGHILVSTLSIIDNNEGIVEYFSDEVFSLIGTNVITNSGLMIDHGDAFRNIKFNDGDALGFPVWNKGLFISPFYGEFSDGIKETLNLNYTEAGSLNISEDWYTDREKTAVAGAWHLTEHHFTPSSSAIGLDSVYFTANLSGSEEVILAVPVKRPTICPQPQITKILRTKTDHAWTDHTSWRGNRAPGHCQKASFSGHEDIFVPTGYKVEINNLEFIPQIGPGRFLEVESGAVFETNLLPYED